MTPSDLAQQRRVITTAAMVVFSVGVLSSLQKGKVLPDGRFLIGFGLAFTITSIMADLGAGRVAAAFALIIMVGTLLENTPEVVSWVQDRSKPSK